jgi:Domain of unknown function (DUF4389)
MSYLNIPPSSSFPQQGGSSRVSDQQPVLVAAAGPARQSRATVALRIILAIPHFVVLYFLGVAVSVVAIIGWFGALFTGRLPDFAAVYLSGYVRWYCRVAAYLLLLTDEYPPFVFQDAAYPVRVAVSPSRLNRLAVLFRFVLAIPAAILSTFLLSGVASIVIFIAWLTALVAGRLPGSLHQAFAAVLRYSARYYGYLYLLTDTYPRGLFGDKPGSEAEDGYGAPDPTYGGPDPAYGRAAGYDAPPGYGVPAYGGPDPAYGRAAGYDAPPDYGAPRHRTAPPGYAEPPGSQTTRAARHRAAAYKTPSQPASWQMVLSGGAKFLVGLILVLGLATTVGEGISAGSVISSARHRSEEINQLNAAITKNNKAIHQNEKAIARVNSALARITSAHAKFDSQLNLVVNASQTCVSVSCFNAEALRGASAVAVFERKLRAVDIPPTSAAAEHKFATDVASYRQGWTGMGHSTSFTDYANRAERAAKAGTRFARDYKALITSLDNLGASLNKQAAVLNQRTTSLNRQAAALNAG